jgi:hypothetical protein
MPIDVIEISLANNPSSNPDFIDELYCMKVQLFIIKDSSIHNASEFSGFLVARFRIFLGRNCQISLLGLAIVKNVKNS